MAYRCKTSNYAGRLFEEGEVYSSIGAALPKYFEEIATEEDVVETDLPGTRDELKAALDELGVEYNPRLVKDKLQELLVAATQSQLATGYDDDDGVENDPLNS